jgi:intracellular sulfur oxidation DsrE/DsrF family protein
MPNRPRRSFLARLAAGASAFGAAVALPRALDAQTPSPSPSPSPSQSQTRESHELDKWLDELRGRHKQIFDLVSKAHISEIAYARNFMGANNSDYAITDSDLSVIVSFRHEATPWGYNDTIWEKYKVGESLDVSIGEAKATRNPMLRSGNGGDGLIAALAARGVHFTCCSLSTGRYAQEWARKVGSTAAEVRADIAANLVPNGRIVPAGVVVLNRAQERGFSYIHVG